MGVKLGGLPFSIHIHLSGQTQEIPSEASHGSGWHGPDRYVPCLYEQEVPCTSTWLGRQTDRQPGGTLPNKTKRDPENCTLNHGFPPQISVRSIRLQPPTATGVGFGMDQAPKPYPKPETLIQSHSHLRLQRRSAHCLALLDLFSGHRPAPGVKAVKERACMSWQWQYKHPRDLRTVGLERGLKRSSLSHSKEQKSLSIK